MQRQERPSEVLFLTPEFERQGISDPCLSKPTFLSFSFSFSLSSPLYQSSIPSFIHPHSFGSDHKYGRGTGQQGRNLPPFNHCLISSRHFFSSCNYSFTHSIHQSALTSALLHKFNQSATERPATHRPLLFVRKTLNYWQ